MTFAVRVSTLADKQKAFDHFDPLGHLGSRYKTKSQKHTQAVEKIRRSTRNTFGESAFQVYTA